MTRPTEISLRFLPAELTLLLVAVLFSADLQAEKKTVRVLTIGSSFADDALTWLPRIVAAADHQLIVGKANRGGCSLERHWNHVAANEQNPQSSEGSPYLGGKASLKVLLTREEWDFVTIQQVSYQSHDLQTFQPLNDRLHAYILQHAPNATILLHQIRAYRIDDPRFIPPNAGKEPHTHAAKHQQVRDAYHSLANRLGLQVLPSIAAMYRADVHSQWGYRIDSTFDSKTARYPSLPDQSHSLHVGWSWNQQADGSHQLRMDGNHASSAGKYLPGCVWFEVLFAESVIGNSFIPEGIAVDYAAFLQQTAHETVAGHDQ